MYQEKKPQDWNLHLTFTGLNNCSWISVLHAKTHPACGFGFFCSVLNQIADIKVGEIPKEKQGQNLDPFIGAWKH